jgi:archaellum biogenesis ATPase FlaH
MIKEELRKKISEQIKTASDEEKIYLFCSSSETYQEVNVLALEELMRKNKRGVYITLSQEYSYLKNSFKDKGIDVSKLHFIDGISMKFGKYSKVDDCTFISGPQSLTDISLTITNLTNSGKYDFIFLDSVSTLLMYNDPKSTTSFIQYLIGKMRGLNMELIIILLDDEKSSKDLKPLISQFCDRVLNCY